MHTDPISDMLNRIKNALRARHFEVAVPYSKHKLEIAKIMKRHGYISDAVAQGAGVEKMLHMSLNSDNKDLNIRKRSKPGQRLYLGYRDIQKYTVGHGLTIFSTSKGLLSAAQAIKEKLGGEIICEMY